MSKQVLVSLLKREIKPALGCTEPASVGFGRGKGVRAAGRKDRQGLYRGQFKHIQEQHGCDHPQ